ncbi:MAG: hypothetical protein HAW58_05850 [Candidatus Thioglobus sp.]|nr:hypothetical protein [Candidatus Thioglobus sp.]
MENKSLFVAITLFLALISGFFFHNQEVTELEQKIAIISKYNAEIKGLKFSENTNFETNSETNYNSDNIDNNSYISTLEDLNNQLISARSALQIAQQKSSLSSSKSSVLTDEISQIKDTRGKVKSLKKSQQKLQQKLQISDKKLKVSDQKLNYLQHMFESQNKNTVNNNIARITELQESAAGIGISGFLLPIVSVAILTSYTVKEVNNYCANIKNIINLEQKVFKKVVSLDAQMQENYQQKCGSLAPAKNSPSP